MTRRAKQGDWQAEAAEIFEQLPIGVSLYSNVN
jgi:hypothetical protein